MIAENLVKVRVSTDSKGGFKDVEINTAILKEVYYQKGNRWYKEERLASRGLALWKKKRPWLSKLFTPVAFWTNEYVMSSWVSARVVFSYGSHTAIVRVKSNRIAIQQSKLVRETLWNKVV